MISHPNADGGKVGPNGKLLLLSAEDLKELCPDPLLELRLIQRPPSGRSLARCGGLRCELTRSKQRAAAKWHSGLTTHGSDSPRERAGCILALFTSENWFTSLGWSLVDSCPCPRPPQMSS